MDEDKDKKATTPAQKYEKPVVKKNTGTVSGFSKNGYLFVVDIHGNGYYIPPTAAYKNAKIGDTIQF